MGTRLNEALGHEAHIYAAATDVFDLRYVFRATVRAGDICGYTYFPDDPERPSEPP